MADALTDYRVTLNKLKVEAERRGYRFEEIQTLDGTLVVRMIRPDGTVAVQARRPVQP
jgi:hypothetical protein